MALKFFQRAAAALRSRPVPSSRPGGQLSDGESIRLVIWDLDETFWRGTLTEGGIEYVKDHHDTVVELAERGIISSICSRNDHATVEALLRDRNLWDYFVFPSIEWGSKGQRVKNIVDSSQLRPQTILFIDDNPMNRAEAKHFVEDIRVADQFVIKDLLGSPLLKGKNDRKLSRLSQYKLLERRANDMKTSDSGTFLYDSDIRVFIDYNIEANLDRAIELINRTNQLNFTKKRLSEDQGQARLELQGLLNEAETQAGLVRVCDRYGDYGFCGLYVQRKWLHDLQPKLIHFCFSCRTLGMDVETWLYQRLGRPELHVEGDVLTDVQDPNKVVDWIRLESHGISADGDVKKQRRIPRIFIRGGCESVAVAHYFEILTDSLVSEFAFLRDNLEVRLDHSQMLRLAVEKPDEGMMQSLRALGYQTSDFDTDLLRQNKEEYSIYIFGFWSEVNSTVFRHAELDFRALVYLGYKIGIETGALLSIDGAALPGGASQKWIQDALLELRKNYVYEGCLAGDLTKQNVAVTMKMLPEESLIFFIGAPEQTVGHDGALHANPGNIDVNASLKSVAAEDRRIHFIDFDRHIKRNSDRSGPNNNRYAREVYYRLFLEIRTKIDEWMASEDMRRSAGSSL